FGDGRIEAPGFRSAGAAHPVCLAKFVQDRSADSNRGIGGKSAIVRGTIVPSGGDQSSDSDAVEVLRFHVSRQFTLHPFNDRPDQWEMTFKKILKRTFL